MLQRLLGHLYRGLRYVEPLAFYARHPSFLRFLLKRRHEDPQHIFREAWRWAKAGRLRMFRRRVFYGIPAERVLHHNLRYHIKWLFPGFAAEIEPLSEAEISLFRAKPSVVVIEHSKCEYALCAALDAWGIHSALMMRAPYVQSEIAVYKFNTRPSVIGYSPSTFIQARTALRAGAVVLGYVDYMHGNTELVSPAIFSFAKRTRSQLLFGRVDISDDGRMRCVFKLPKASGEDDLMTELRAFNRH